VRTSPLKFRGDVPERYTGDVRLGDSAIAILQSDKGEPLQGKIVRVSPSVSTESRSFSIEAEFDNQDERVKPGSFARVSILSKTVVQALTIPETALFSFAGNPRVFVVEGDRARERVVETDGKEKDRILVSKGLSKGDKVVTGGVELLSDGRLITLREEAAR
jgi:RND family efflux transporter MFP subunit